MNLQLFCSECSCTFGSETQGLAQDWFYIYMHIHIYMYECICYLFIYLAALGLSLGRQTLSHSMWDPVS